jgi:transaldolase
MDMLATEGVMVKLTDLRVKIFADGADLEGMKRMYAKPWIKGFTTNPTLMRKAGVLDYKAFACEVVRAVPDRPVSFEVLADDFEDMEAQALEIASWGENINVKIPITNTKRESTCPVIQRLSSAGVKLNITAVFTVDQVRAVIEHLDPRTPAMISVFAGRIADTGVDPMPVLLKALQLIASHPKAELLWASPREILNVVQAHAMGCHIITVTHDLLNKLPLLGKDHADFSLETVEMFYRDAVAAGYCIPLSKAEKTVWA